MKELDITDKKILEIQDKTIFDGYIIKVILKGIFKTWFKLTGWNRFQKYIKLGQFGD